MRVKMWAVSTLFCLMTRNPSMLHAIWWPTVGLGCFCSVGATIKSIFIEDGLITRTVLVISTGTSGWETTRFTDWQHLKKWCWGLIWRILKGEKLLLSIRMWQFSGKVMATGCISEDTLARYETASAYTTGWHLVQKTETMIKQKIIVLQYTKEGGGTTIVTMWTSTDFIFIMEPILIQKESAGTTGLMSTTAWRPQKWKSELRNRCSYIIEKPQCTHKETTEENVYRVFAQLFPLVCGGPSQT